MKITILCSDTAHPINAYLERWMMNVQPPLTVDLIRSNKKISFGDILFLVSCSEIVTAQDRSAYGACLVLHASDLPIGRGWSPHIWEISQGADVITLSLLEAEDEVDTGRIWKKIQIPVPQHSLWDEINHLLFQAEIELIEFAIKNPGTVKPTPQATDVTATYYPKRSPSDSRIDPFKSIAEQFDLIRVCDSNRFPAHFDYLGQRYILKIEKSNEQ